MFNQWDREAYQTVDISGENHWTQFQIWWNNLGSWKLWYAWKIVFSSFLRSIEMWRGYVACVTKTKSLQHLFLIQNVRIFIFDAIFTELEGWIPDTLRLLAVSRTGLSQGEIFTLLRGLGYRNSKEVRNFQWLQFCTCFKDWIYELPSGQVQFAHQHLKEIVEYVLLRKYHAILYIYKDSWLKI